MTIIVQFEMHNWYAEGVAIMSRELFDHPIMDEAIRRIAKDQGFDFVSEFERETDYRTYHELADKNP